MALATYDADKLVMVFAGIPITGYADGTFVGIDNNEESFGLMVGSDGDACRYKTNNNSARITFTLGQWSVTNNLLSALLTLDIEGVTEGIGPLLIKDLSGTSIFACEKAWLVKPPLADFDRAPTNREWIIETDNLKRLDGSQL